MAARRRTSPWCRRSRSEGAWAAGHLLPFILMDVPADNTLPDPYRDNAAGDRPAGLSVARAHYFFARRRICRQRRQAPPRPTQIADLFGDGEVADFDVDDETSAGQGPDEWSLRRMILHYAHLCAAAGGVDAFLIGSELRGLFEGGAALRATPP